MSQAIWILQYDLTSGSEYEYLNWFHTIHIPEKLGGPVIYGQFITRDILGLLTTVKIEGLILRFLGEFRLEPSLTQALLNCVARRMI